MRQTILIALIFLTYIKLTAQNTFETLISEPEDQVINTITEDNEGNFIMVGRYKNSSTNYPGAYLIKIDELGNLLQQKIITYSDTNSYILNNIHDIGSSYFVFGSYQDIGSLKTKLWFLKLDEDLNIESEKIKNIPSDRWFSYMNSILDSDSNFVLTGYTTRPDTVPPSPYNNDPFFYKISMEGDSLVSKFITSISILDLSYDLIDKLDQTGYYAYGRKYNPELSYAGQRYELGKDLDSIFIDTIPRLIHTYYSPKRLGDSLILVCGEGGFPDYSPPYSLNVLSTTDENLAVNYNNFKIAGYMREYPAVYNGVSIYNDNIYIGGTSNADYADPFWSSFDSWFHLVKLNPDLTPIWEYWYGGDAYYQLYSIMATDDGGCIMVGNRYDDEIQDHERDVFVVKVNSEGLLVGTEETSSEPTCEAIIFPNPGTNELKVRIAIQHPQSVFQLYDMNGKQVLHQNITGQWGEMNTTFLSPGTYMYRITAPGGLLEIGKWVRY